MTLQSEAEELYALPLEHFTERRNERAKEVRASGDRELAARIRKLPKPRRSAWVLNMLVRRLPDDVDRLVELGAQIRTSRENANRDELRALDQQRRELTGELTRQSRTIAAELGHDVNDPLAAEIENTLRAAMADPVGGAAVRTGLLVDGFGSTGFEPVDLDVVVAVPDAVSVPESPQPVQGPPQLRLVREPTKPTKNSRARAKAPDPAARERRRAAEALEVAREAVAEADKTRLKASQAYTEAVNGREELEHERTALQERLRTVDRELARAHRTEDKAQREHERAERDYSAAQRELERA
ncbi:hypothetical protein [Solicola gregarius]|uniref:Uncharacterized protein n=1 Tax=Solicola gregarius TaxID=2908642 RepID=A0AA46THB9_9ACTN|nr:hypothetical protein [Solicola gregarius]UYM05166.1 hypothetical protein L0C25_22025 [Solicola gregarius]